MKRLIFATVATVTLVVSLSSQAMSATSYAGTQSKSSPVQAFLDRLGMKYIEEDGNFKVVAGVDGGRTQIGLILPTTLKMDDVEYIRVISFSQISNIPLDAKISKQLDANIADPLSGSITIDTNGMYITGYYKMIPLKDDPDSARRDLLKVLNIADTAEKDLTGKDEF